MKSYTLWTNAEHANFIKLLSEGKNYLEISAILGRSRGAIASRAQECRRRTNNPIEPTKIIAPKTELISEPDVSVWYALGWRFTGFYAGQCRMEWPSTKPERRPRVVRALEVA